MKEGFKKAARLYKYLAIFFSVVYWIYFLIDHNNSFHKYLPNEWADITAIWFVWFMVYLFGLSVYYWGISVVVVFVYYKIIRRKYKQKQNL